MHRFNILLALTLFGAPIAAISQNDAVAFTVSPQQCIALHKGQTCYQDVLFYWQMPDNDEYCLVLAEQEQPLTCRNGKGVHQYQYRFEGNSTTTFSLIRNDDVLPIAQTKVVVTWIYKAPKQSQSGWRLF